MAGGSKQALRHTTTMQLVSSYFPEFFLMKIKLNNSFLRKNYSKGHTIWNRKIVSIFFFED